LGTVPKGPFSKPMVMRPKPYLKFILLPLKFAAIRFASIEVYG